MTGCLHRPIQESAAKKPVHQVMVAVDDFAHIASTKSYVG
jgi:hypothetical protein